MRKIITVLKLSLLFLLINSFAVSQTIMEYTYIANVQIPAGTSQLFYINVSNLPTNAFLTNVEARFTYIAYNGVQNGVSVRFNRGSDPGTSGGVLLVAQGSLPSGNPGTYGYVPYSNWNYQLGNSNYYFRFAYASGYSTYNPTLQNIQVKLTYILSTLNVTYPTSGTIWNIGNTYNTTWNSSNVNSGIQIDLYKGGTNVHHYETSAPNTGSYSCYLPTDLVAGTDYRIGISAYNGYISSFSPYFTISSSPPPNPPTLISPNQDSIMTDLTPDLVWQGSGVETGYGGQVATNSSFTSNLIENQNIQANNWTPTLTQYTKYYWRIRGRTGLSNWGNWSSTRSFTCANNPILITPAHNSTITTNEINFQWSDCSALRYELYVDNNSSFNSPEISKYNITELGNYTQISYQISGNWLEENKYHWKVMAYYPNGSNATSIRDSFIYSPPKSSSPNWIPIYRAYKSSVTDHFYCTSLSHLDTAIQHGYVFEKVDGYLSLTPFLNAPYSANVFRIYIGKHDSHFYTSNPATKDSIMMADITNIYEGIIGYGYASNSATADLVQFYYVFKKNLTTPILSDHFYTISDVEKNNAIQNSYVDMGFIAYVSPNGEEATEPWMEMQPEIGYGLNPQNGNVGSYNKTSFYIPGAKMSLSFMHIYNSYTTRLMSQVNSIGAGWSHNYMATLTQNNGKYYVIWPGGGIHVYNVSDLKPVTKGVYDKLIKVSGTRYQIKRKDQTVFSFDVLNAAIDSTAFLTSIRDRNNNRDTCAYNIAERKLTSVTSAENRTLMLTYFSESGKTHLIKEVTDPIGRKIKYEYDTDNNLIKFTDAKNQITQYLYDTTARYDHLLKKIIFPRGNSIVNNFSNKKITSQTQNSNGVTLNLTYNTLNTVVKDESNNQYTIYYNAQKAGLISQLLTPSGSAYYEYNDVSNNPVKPSKITDGKGYITTITYDLMGNPLQINKPESAIHKFTYNSFNDVTQYTDPRNKITNYGYNGSGNLTSIQSPRGITNITYNNNGTINTITDPLSRLTTLGYNSFGNMTSSRNNLNSTTYYSYDNVSRLLTMTDANSRTTNYSYDNNDLVTTVSKPGSVNINYNYDANDNVSNIVNPNNRITSYTYNGRDLLQNMTNPLSKQTSYDYFDNSALKSKIKPDNQIINYAYDASNRLSNISGAITGTINYDNNDNVTSISDGVNGNISYTYDGLNRITSCTDYYNNMVSYGYDQASNITSITYPGNKVVTYAYYDDNLLQSVTDWNGKVTTYTYRNDGSLQNVQYPNMTKKTFTYDGAGRIIGISNTKSDNSIISNYTFTLDNVGNQLSASQTEPYNAPILNTSSKLLTYNNADRIISDGTNSYTFDDNGNLQSKTGGTTSSYVFDGDNKLTSMSGEYTASFKYDLNGNRRFSNVNGTIKKYILDVNTSLPKVLMETDNNGNVLNYYIYGLELVSRVKSDGTTNYYHSDFRGSVIAMTDAVQNITHKYSYGSFGQILQSNEANANPFKYIGSYGVMEESNGLYFMRARYYDSKIGRFISEDPVWDVNLYPYADNNPMMNIDASGLESKDIFNNIKESIKNWWNNEKISLMTNIVVKGIKGINWKYQFVMLGSELLRRKNPDAAQVISGNTTILTRPVDPLSWPAYIYNAIFHPGRNSREVEKTAEANARFFHLRLGIDR